MNEQGVLVFLEGPARCGNGHALGADGVCSHERGFLEAAAARGLDPDVVREVGWVEADRAARRAMRYAP